MTRVVPSVSGHTNTTQACSGTHAAASAPGAISSLEEALVITDECCDGFHDHAPMAQLALARALWDTGGDRDARLGVHREVERQAAITWLAAHPP
jgi:hypothetical protein